MTKAVVKLEGALRDKVFQDTLTLDTIKSLSVVIFQSFNDGRSMKDVQRMTGLSASQIQYIQSTKEYFSSIQGVVDNDSDITRTLLRPHKISVIEALMDKVKEGDMAAIKEYFKQCDSAVETTASYQDVWYEMMKSFGVKTRTEENTEKLRRSNEIEESDDPDIIECEVVTFKEGSMTEEEERIAFLKKQLEIED